MLKNRIVSELEAPVMGVFQSPRSTVVGEFTVKYFNFGLSLNIFSEGL